MEKEILDCFAQEVKEGLTSNQKSLSSKYFYDDRGSELFQKIMHLPGYYLFNAEKDILQRHSSKLASRFENDEINIVELGVGDGKKTVILLNSFLRKEIDLQLMVIDISQKALKEFKARTKKENHRYPIKCVNADYVKGLKWLHEKNDRKNLVLFLGSSIGNFSEKGEEEFLKNIRSALDEKDFMLIGFDLTRDKEKVMAAYDDPEGVTSQFNLNILERINRELNANFNLDNFEHVPVYNEQKQRMESYIESKKNQVVEIKDLDLEIEFERGEKIQTEISRKYTIEDIDELAEKTGFKKKKNYYNEKENFVLSLWSTES